MIFCRLFLSLSHTHINLFFIEKFGVVNMVKVIFRYNSDHVLVKFQIEVDRYALDLYHIIIVEILTSIV